MLRPGGGHPLIVRLIGMTYYEILLAQLASKICNSTAILFTLPKNFAMLPKSIIIH